MEIRRDELFHFVRWINLIVGALNVYLFSIGGGHHFLALGVLNAAVWAITRKIKNKVVK